MFSDMNPPERTQNRRQATESEVGDFLNSNMGTIGLGVIVLIMVATLVVSAVTSAVG